MNHDLLKNIIYDQHELIQNADIVARPSYSFEPNANYVLVGLRRAGKSTFSKLYRTWLQRELRGNRLFTSTLRMSGSLSSGKRILMTFSLCKAN